MVLHFLNILLFWGAAVVHGRNFLGQKFALMEEKIILASIFRNFYVKSLDKRDELILLGELILRPRDGIRLRLTPKIRN